MTELMPYAPEQAANKSVGDLVAWAESARAAANIAVSLVKTSFVPAAFRNKPEEATAAILSGVELGLSPMAALRSFDLIQGTAAPRAMTLRAVVQAAGHEIWTETSTDAKAVVCGQRRGSDKVERSVWTLDRARGLQLTGKDAWKKQPQAMLLARATSECARLVAADAILGIPYSAEEIADLEPEPTTPVTRAATTKPVKRTAPPKPEAPEPPLDEPLPPAEPEQITDAQLKKLHACMNDRGFTDRDLGLAFLSEALDREITSSKDLTKDEASRAIDLLEVPGFDEPTEAPADGGWPDVAQPGTKEPG